VNPVRAEARIRARMAAVLHRRRSADIELASTDSVEIQII
jgi:hypothetical protein